MKIKVTRQFDGHRMSQRLNFRVPGRPNTWATEYVPSESWGRGAAREALDFLEHVYEINRRNVRFDVR